MMRRTRDDGLVHDAGPLSADGSYDTAPLPQVLSEHAVSKTKRGAAH